MKNNQNYTWIYWPVMLLFSIANTALCQPLATCSDLEVASGMWTPAWIGSYGKWKEQLNPCNIIYTSVAQGMSPTQHQIWNAGSGTISCFGNNTIPYVPPGYSHAIMLGNADDGREWERLETQFIVTPDNAAIEMNLAVFFEDDGHNPCRQPRFWMKVLDENGQIVPCGDYQVVASGNLPGWGTSYCGNFSPIRYLPWTKITVDLRAYLGQKIKLQFQSMDCSENGHFGFALFTLKCQKPEITATTICPGTNNSITLTAPDGYSSYQWNTGATTRSITINSPVPGTIYTVNMTPFSNLTGSCQVTLQDTIPPIPALTMPPNMAICPGASAILTASVNVGTWSYHWSNGATAPTTTVQMPGIYQLMATSGTCTMQGQVQVSAIPPPQSNFVVTDALCHQSNGHVSLTPLNPAANYAYGWPGGQTGGDQSLPAGQYTVTITDLATTCTSTVTVSIQEPPALQLFVTPPVEICIGDTAHLTAQGNFVQYSWSNGANGPGMSTNVAGVYTVTVVNDEGCSTTGSTEVIVHPTPIPHILGPDSICTGATTHLYTDILYPAYQWSTGAQTSAVEVAPGTYSITVVDVHGCIGQGNKPIEAIPLLPVTMVGTDYICPGDTANIQLTIPGANSGTVWLSTASSQGFNLQLANGLANYRLSPQATGMIRIDSIDVPGYHCPFTGLPASVLVEVDDMAVTVLPVLKPNGFAILCPLDSSAVAHAQVEGGYPPYHLDWSLANQHNLILENLPAGTYTVTVTGARGCTGIGTGVVAPPPALVTAVTAVAPVCRGVNTGAISFNLLSGQGDALVRINGQSALSIPASAAKLAPGLYHIHVTDDYCIWDTTVVFPELPAYFVNLPDSIVQLELLDSYVVYPQTNAPVTSFYWTPTTYLDDSTAWNPTMTPLVNTHYALTATTKEGCVLQDVIKLKVSNDQLVYVPDVFCPECDSDNSRFVIHAKAGVVHNLHLEIFDRWGNMVFQNKEFLPDDPASAWDGSVRGKLVDPAVFVYNLTIEYVDQSIEKRQGDITVYR